MSEFGSVRKGCDMKKASVLRWLLSLNVLVRFKLITRPGLERLPYIPAQSADYKMGGTLCGTVRANRGYCWAKMYSAMQA